MLGKSQVKVEGRAYVEVSASKKKETTLLDGLVGVIPVLAREFI